jgi:stage V sporulation protein SpoVS
MLTEGEILDRLVTVFADPAGAGNTQLVTAPPAGQKIVVFGYQLFNNAGTANNVRFQSAAINKTSLKALAANAGAYAMPTGIKLFECNAAEALNINLSAATAIGVDVQYLIQPV